MTLAALSALESERSAAFTALAALESERSSTLLGALRQQAEQLEALQAHVAALAGWRASATHELAALRSEVVELRAANGSAVTTATGGGTPGGDSGGGLGASPGTPSIVIRSATGALAMRRRQPPAASYSSPVCGEMISSDGSVLSIPSATDEVIIELVMPHLSARQPSLDAGAHSPATPSAAGGSFPAIGASPAVAAAAASPPLGPAAADASAVLPPPPSGPTSAVGYSPSGLAKVDEDALIGDDAPGSLEGGDAAAASTTTADRPAGKVETRWPGTPSERRRSKLPVAAGKGGGATFVSHKPKGRQLPRSVCGSQGSSPTEARASPSPLAGHTPSPLASTPSSKPAAAASPASGAPPAVSSRSASLHADAGRGLAAGAERDAALLRPLRLSTPLVPPPGRGGGAKVPAISCVVLSEDGRCLVSGTEDGFLHLWVRGKRLNAGWARAFYMRGCPPAGDDGDEAICALALRGTVLLSGGADGVVRSWRAAVIDEEYEADEGEDEDVDGELVVRTTFESCSESLQEGTAGIQCLAMPPGAAAHSGTTAGGGGGTRGGGPKVAWALPDKWAVSGGQDKALCVWESEGGELLQRELMRTWVMAVSTAIGADGRPLVLSAAADGEVVLWQARPHLGSMAYLQPGAGPLERCRRLLTRNVAAKAHTQLVSARLSADGRHAIAGLQNGELRLWTAAVGAAGGLEETAAEPTERIAKLPTEVGGGEGGGLGALEWRTDGDDGANGSASPRPPPELVVGSARGDVSRWRWSAEGVAPPEMLQALAPPDGGGEAQEIYGLACYAPSGEVFAATADGDIRCLEPDLDGE